MILHLAPDAPLAARLAADAALFGHIGGGTIGIAAGFVTVAARKGGRLHRAAGTAFFAAMLLAYSIGCVVSPMIHQPANSFAGAFGVYLVLTGWLTVKRPPAAGGRTEAWAAAMIACVAVVLVAYALVGVRNPAVLAGVPWQAPAVCAGLGLLAASSDLRVAMAGGIAGAARLRRHLWRMCAGFFFGTASLFIGQPRVFPPGLRGSPLLIALAIAPLLIMAFWLYRTRSRRSPRPAATITPAQEALT